MHGFYSSSEIVVFCGATTQIGPRYQHFDRQIAKQLHTHTHTR